MSLERANIPLPLSTSGGDAFHKTTSLFKLHLHLEQNRNSAVLNPSISNSSADRTREKSAIKQEELFGATTESRVERDTITLKVVTDNDPLGGYSKQPNFDLQQPTHVIVSGVLGYSTTFALYRNILAELGSGHCYVPHELPVLDGTPDLAGLNALLQLMRGTANLRSIVISDPYKQCVIPLLDSLTPVAQQCGAVNLVTCAEGVLIGDNLDGPAFRLGIESELGLSFRRQRMVFFGCGGVSSAVAVELARELSRVALVDIKPNQSRALKQRLLDVNPKLRVDLLDRGAELDLMKYSLFYNGTGLGKFRQSEQASMLMPVHLFDQIPARGIAFDANYTPWETAFLRRFSSCGFATINGFSHMLGFVTLHLSRVLDREIEFDFVMSCAEKVDSQAVAPWK